MAKEITDTWPPPWIGANEHGEIPGDICCQRAMGEFCYEHDRMNYIRKSDGSWTEYNWDVRQVDSHMAKIKGRSKVDHPAHYNAGKYEVIDVIEDWSLGFNLGNAIKYIARADHKGHLGDDLEKACWYVLREIAFRRKTPLPCQCSKPRPVELATGGAYCGDCGQEIAKVALQDV